MGRRTNPLLAQSKPPPGKGFRGVDRERQSLGLHCLGAAADQEISRTLRQCFLDTIQLFRFRFRHLAREFFPSVNYLTPLARLPELFCRAWADRPSIWEISDGSRRWTIFQFGPCGPSRSPFGSFHVSRSSRLARSPGYSIACCGCARERRRSPDVSRHTENQPALQLCRGDEAARTGC